MRLPGFILVNRKTLGSNLILTGAVNSSCTFSALSATVTAELKGTCAEAGVKVSRAAAPGAGAAAGGVAGGTCGAIVAGGVAPGCPGVTGAAGCAAAPGAGSAVGASGRRLKFSFTFC